MRVDSANALGASTAAANLVLNAGTTFVFNTSLAQNYALTGGTVNVQGNTFTWAGAPTLTAPTTLNFNGGTNGGILSGNLADTGASVLSLNKSGAGRVTLTGNNSYTGATTVTQGRLELGSAGAISAGSNLVFNGAVGIGGTIEVTNASGNFIRNLGAGAGQVRWLGDGGFLSSGSSRTVNLGGAGETVSWGAGGFVPTGNRLIRGTDSNNRLDFQNGIDLSGGIRAVQGDGGTISGHARMTGILSGAIGLNQVGNGFLELTGANSYTGGTVATSGIRRALRRAAESGSEDRVHHEFRPFKRGWRQWLDRAAPPFCMMAGFALQTVARPEQSQAHRPTGFDKMPGGHEAVAAIIAGAAQDRDGARRPAFYDLARDRGARILH